jgi:SAM-dependent methyltransferase
MTSPATPVTGQANGLIRLAQSFMSSRVLLSAAELGLFTFLGDDERDITQICAATGLHERCAADFLDTLVALGLLERTGPPGACYRNSAESRLFLSADGRLYLGGLLEMMGGRLFRQWADLTECLRTGEPQAEAGQSGDSLFNAIYARGDGTRKFSHAMAGASMSGRYALVRKVDFSGCERVADVGGNDGQLAILLARRFPALRATIFDLPALAAAARANIEASGADVAGRVDFRPGDFFRDPLPRADAVVMSLVLHNWGDTDKRRLIGAAYDALSPDGMFVAIDNLIDDDRRERLPALLGSVNMLLQTDRGRGYSAAEFRSWAAAAGFAAVTCEPLAHSLYALIARKGEVRE